MNEFFKQRYKKEEEFIELFPDVCSKASELLGEDWSPDVDCNDGKRKDRIYYFSIGDLKSLVFHEAAIYHRNNRFSSAQITLRSSRRLVTIKVKMEDGMLVAEKTSDRKQTSGS